MKLDNMIEMAAKYGSNHSTFDKQRIGAIVKQGNSLYFGANKRRTHPKSPGPWKFIHAEFDALMACARWTKTEGAEMFVGRYDLNGKPAMAKPCHFCRYMMRRAGIAIVYYSMPNCIGSLIP